MVKNKKGKRFFLMLFLRILFAKRSSVLCFCAHNLSTSYRVTVVCDVRWVNTDELADKLQTVQFVSSITEQMERSLTILNQLCVHGLLLTAIPKTSP